MKKNIIRVKKSIDRFFQNHDLFEKKDISIFMNDAVSRDNALHFHAEGRRVVKVGVKFIANDRVSERWGYND